MEIGQLVLPTVYLFVQVSVLVSPSLTLSPPPSPSQVGSCPNPGNTTMNGDVNIYTTYPLTQDGHYIENTTIKVTCYDGYSVSDGGESICLSNGNWSASSSNGIPICTGESCTPNSSHFSLKMLMCCQGLHCYA